MSDVAFWGAGDGSALAGFRQALRAEWVRRGHGFVEGADPNAACVFNFVNPDDPKPFRRRQLGLSRRWLGARPFRRSTHG